MRCVTFAFLFICASHPGWAQDWRALERRLGSHDEGERSAAVRAISDTGGLQAAQLLQPLLEDANPYVRDLVIERLGAIGGGEVFGKLFAKVPRKLKARGMRAYAWLFPEFREVYALSPLFQLVRDRDVTVRETALFALRDVLALAARDSEVRGSFPESDWPAERRRRIAAREAVSNVSSEVWRETAARLTKDRDARVRAAGLFAFGRLADPVLRREIFQLAWGEDPRVLVAWLDQWFWVDRDRARELAEDSLTHGAPRVEVTAAHVLERCGNEGSVARLIDRLVVAEDHPFVARPVAQALAQLTGMKFGPRGAEWRRWFRDQGEGYRLPRETKRVAAMPRTATVTYHGLPVDGRRIAFVIDGSGSMRDVLDASDRRTKFERAIDELESTLARLPDGTLVQVILFADEPRAMDDAFTALDAKSRVELGKWLGRQSVRGKTNLLDAMTFALELDDVEAVYVLSDGAPSAGEHVFQERVRRAVRDRNATVCAAIHTVLFRKPSSDPDEEKRLDRHQRLMQRLAEESGGEFVAVQ